MTLQVPFEDFASAAQRFQIQEAYVHAEGAVSVVTATNLTSGQTLLSQVHQNAAYAKKKLEGAGITVYAGIWSESRIALEPQTSNLFVAAVSYKSGTSIPGVWVDAYEEEPNHIQVVEALYEEFKRTGEMPEISIEEFMRNANPNVVVVSQSQLRGYVLAKSSETEAASD